MSRMNLAAVLTVALLGLAAGRAIAHGDEDHSQDKKPAAAVKSAPTGTVPAEATAAQRLPDGSLFVPKGVQRQHGLRHVVAAVGELAATVEFNGRVIADPNAGGRIQATQSGRIESGPKGLPTLGQKVVKGQVLAYLRPVANSIERANQHAQFAEIDAQLAIAERKLARYEQLEGIVSASAIETARLEVDALKKRRSAVGASIDAPEPLVAPVYGVIGAANVVVGQSLKVIAQTARTVKGVALPQAALVKVSTGETAVWVRDGAERFVLRKVHVQPLDAATVAVTSGLANGERVVTDGAGLLVQVR